LRSGLRTPDRKIDLPATLMFDYPTPERIAAYLDTLLAGGVRPGSDAGQTVVKPGSDPKPGAATDLSEAQLAEMSEAEAEALLLERLERI
jgi:hypothetical protein